MITSKKLKTILKNYIILVNNWKNLTILNVTIKDICKHMKLLLQLVDEYRVYSISYLSCGAYAQKIIKGANRQKYRNQTMSGRLSITAS